MTRTAKSPTLRASKVEDYRWARAMVAIVAVGMIVGAILTT